MAIKNEAARLFFAISSLLLVAMLTSTPTGDTLVAPITPAMKRELASVAKAKKMKLIADKKTSRKLVKKS